MRMVTISDRVLQAVQKPRRLRDVAEDVNDGRVGWDALSDRDVTKVLEQLRDEGLVQQRGAWWHRS